MPRALPVQCRRRPPLPPPPLRLHQLQPCLHARHVPLQAAGYPPDEAASKERLAYRLEHGEHGVRERRSSDSEAEAEAEAVLYSAQRLLGLGASIRRATCCC